MQRESFAGFVLVNSEPCPSKNLMAMDVSEEERQKEYERRWQSGGLCFYTAFNDLLIDPRANESLAEFVRGKIRERVNDPKTAELLSPRTYPILTKRLCADTDYMETYNRPNVSLVSVRDTPIERITETGLVVGGKAYEFDIIVHATGFDAVTGALSRMDIRGRDGKLLRDHWSEGLRSYMGMACSGFPNMFFMDGPGSPGPLFHPVMLSEYQGEWILDCVEHMAMHRVDAIEADPAQEAAWVAHSNEVAAGTLLPAAESWYYGCNIPGKPRVMLAYVGGLASYLQWCADAAADGYAKFRLSAAADTAGPGRATAAVAH
jgi:cyclohexanone monooxygenase